MLALTKKSNKNSINGHPLGLGNSQLCKYFSHGQTFVVHAVHCLIAAWATCVLCSKCPKQFASGWLRRRGWKYQLSAENECRPWRRWYPWATNGASEASRCVTWWFNHRRDYKACPGIWFPWTWWWSDHWEWWHYAVRGRRRGRNCGPPPHWLRRLLPLLLGWWQKAQEVKVVKEEQEPQELQGKWALQAKVNRLFHFKATSSCFFIATFAAVQQLSLTGWPHFYSNWEPNWHLHFTIFTLFLAYFIAFKK